MEEGMVWRTGLDLARWRMMWRLECAGRCGTARSRHVEQASQKERWTGGQDGSERTIYRNGNRVMQQQIIAGVRISKDMPKLHV